jgi:hypothetical protein
MQRALLTIGYASLIALHIPAYAQEATPLGQDEALSFVNGKKLDTTNARFGRVNLDLRSGGRLYGANQGQTDSGEWRVEDGKLCLKWRRWEYEGCGVLQRRGDKIEHLYPDGRLHFTFVPK